MITNILKQTGFKKILNKEAGVFSIQYTQFRNFVRIVKKDWIHIYPKDKVIVLPPFGDLELTEFEKKVIENKEKFSKSNKIEAGTVIRMYRKRGLALVEGVNVKPFYKPIQEYFTDYEKKELNKIKPRSKPQPVDINRLRLRDVTKEGMHEIKIKIEDGKRVNAETGDVIPVPAQQVTYLQRNAGRAEGPRDTTSEYVIEKTYKGENFAAVMKEFIDKIKEKKYIESLLVLKDK